VYLEGHPEYNIVVVQTEDEISAITMATGAALTGVRASTSTSGPGFSLMAEGLGWAAINEVPIVVFDYQRGGPSTGLPTRHEQADLQFALHAGHGEFPRIVLAPGDLEEYFADAFRAFNLAERYQTPVIVLNDKALANTTQTVFPFDESELRIQRSVMAEVNGNASANGHGFPRFAFTESGISPRVLHGQEGGVHWLTGDEHNEVGHITEEPHTRLEMQAKRMRKIELATLEIPQETQWRLYGPARADFTIVGWGSTKGAVIDAIDELETEGLHANFLQIRLLSPFPAEAVRKILEGTGTVVDIESNYTGQLASLIREHTGFHVHHRVLKWTGRPISQTEVVSAIKEIAERKTERVVLTYGL
jgi:2-oxoglutarate ferredoxin oxidoreductase subunit alpha